MNLILLTKKKRQYQHLSQSSKTEWCLFAKKIHYTKKYQILKHYSYITPQTGTKLKQIAVGHYSLKAIQHFFWAHC